MTIEEASRDAYQLLEYKNNATVGYLGSTIVAYLHKDQRGFVGRISGNTPESIANGKIVKRSGIYEHNGYKVILLFSGVY